MGLTSGMANGFKLTASDIFYENLVNPLLCRNAKLISNFTKALYIHAMISMEGI
jgi:hypothetical protein